MTQEERVDALIRKLRRCYRFIHNHADGGKWSQARALRQLRYHGEMTQRMLQEHMSIQQSSMSDLVKKLEEQQLIVRTPCPEDRRQVMISLTDSGRAQLAASEEADLQQNISYLQVLTPQEQQTLLDLLTKLDASWVALYPKKDWRYQGEEVAQK